MSGYLGIDITFLSGQIERSKSQLQPLIKDGFIIIKYIGDNSGGLFVPISSVRMMKVVPQNGFNMDEAVRRAATEELENMKS